MLHCLKNGTPWRRSSVAMLSAVAFYDHSESDQRQQRVLVRRQLLVVEFPWSVCDQLQPVGRHELVQQLVLLMLFQLIVVLMLCS